MADDDDLRPKCDKCGKEITTGLMAVLCEHGKECALRGDDESAESVDFFREAFGTNQEQAMSNTQHQDDPLNMPLPCDVKIGPWTFRKGVRLGTLVLSAQRWHREAFPDGYLLTDEQKAENLARLQSVCSAGGGEPIYLVATGQVYEGRETYERHEGKPPPMCDYEGPLYAGRPTTEATEPLMVNGFAELVRARLAPLLNEYGMRQWQSGRGVKHESIDDAFEAVIAAARGGGSRHDAFPARRRCSTRERGMTDYTELRAKAYPLDVQNVGGDTYILMSKGHHDPHEFMRAASEWSFAECLGMPQHKWVKAVPCRCGQHRCHYTIGDERRPGWFPATYAWEAYGKERYAALREALSAPQGKP